MVVSAERCTFPQIDAHTSTTKLYYKSDRITTLFSINFSLSDERLFKSNLAAEKYTFPQVYVVFEIHRKFIYDTLKNYIFLVTYCV